MPSRVRARAKARARMGRRKLEPRSEVECLEEIRKKQLTGWELLRFLYDCIKRARS